MNLKTQLKSLQNDMQGIIDGAKGRDLTDAEVSTIEAKHAEAVELKGKIERADSFGKVMDALNGAGDSDGSQKSRLAFAGRGAKRAAADLARRIPNAVGGSKAFAAEGATLSAATLTPEVVVEAGRPPVSLLEVLNAHQHDTAAFRYMRQTVRTNNAAIVAPGDTKPTSVVTVDEVEDKLQVFAHLSEYVDKYLLADNDALERFLSAQLFQMLAEKVESEILTGDGTTGHLDGLAGGSISGVQSQAFTVDPITTLRMAMLELETASLTPDVFVIAASDWATIETTRATSGSFDLGGPIDRAERKLWGVQVVPSAVLDEGTALALDLSTIGVDTDQEGVKVEWDTLSGFDSNEVRARVEGRFGLSVFQPNGIVRVALAEDEETTPEA